MNKKSCDVLKIGDTWRGPSGKLLYSIESIHYFLNSDENYVDLGWINQEILQDAINNCPDNGTIGVSLGYLSKVITVNLNIFLNSYVNINPTIGDLKPKIELSLLERIKEKYSDYDVKLLFFDSPVKTGVYGCMVVGNGSLPILRIGYPIEDTSPERWEINSACVPHVEAKSMKGFRGYVYHVEGVGSDMVFYETIAPVSEHNFVPDKCINSKWETNPTCKIIHPVAVLFYKS